jgi:hypothetical protein
MRIRWTPSDDELLAEAYRGEVGAPDLPPALLERHSLHSCRSRAYRLGMTNHARAQRYPPEDMSVVDPVDLAYLAGLIDADGNVTRPGVTPRISVTGTCLPVVAWVASLPNFRLSTAGTTSTGKTVYRSVCTSRLACAEVARALEGYMREPSKVERLVDMGKFTNLAYT